MRRTLLLSAVVVLTVVTGPPLASAAPAAPVERSGVATGSGPLAPGDWGQYRNGAPSGGFNQAETTLSPSTVKGLQLRRKVAASSLEGGQAGATGHGLLYTSGPAAGIAAYDETTGAPVWSAPKGSNEIAVGDSAVYTVLDGDGLYAYRPDTGALLWHRAVPGSPYLSPPTLAGSRVLLGAHLGSVSEVMSTSAATGGVQWRTRLPGSGQVSHVAVSNGMAVVTVEAANVYALDTATGALRWSFQTEGGGGGVTVPSPVIRDQRVFVGLVDGVFRALELSTGRLIWSRNLGAVIFTTAAEANGVVYAATAAADPAEKDLFALDSQNGSVRWARASGSDASSPTLANGVLYIGTYFGGNALKAYNAATGAELATYPIRKQTLSEPMVSHGTVYLRAGGGPHGQVFVFTA